MILRKNVDSFFKKMLFTFLWCCTTQLLPRVIHNKRFVIALCSYNNSAWYKQNLDSALSQHYPHFRIIYVDDASTDGTGDLVEEYKNKHDRENKITLIRNSHRQRQLANHYKIIHLCNDHEIIVVLDGDDMFAHGHVLTKLNFLYQRNIWMTYGSYINKPTNKIPRWLRSINTSKLTRGYREHPWIFEHLRSYYAWLAKCVKLKDLIFSKPLPREQLKIYLPRRGGVIALNEEQYNRALKESHDIQGKFFPSASDPALMIPMAEMAHGKIQFVKDILYYRNIANPLNTIRTTFLKHRFSWAHILAANPYKARNAPLTNKNLPEKADVIIFSTSPIKFLRTVIEIKKKVKGVHTIYGLTPNNPDTLARYAQRLETSKIQFFSSFDAFLASNVRHILKHASDFILLYDDTTNALPEFSLDLYRSTKLLKQTAAYAFYFDHPHNDTLPSHEQLEHKIYFWQFALGSHEWRQPHNLHLTLYRKKYLVNALKDFSHGSLADFKEHWQNAPYNKRDIGLFYIR